ncbi:hypothetical protein GQ600_1218 [Phytophthora cactorum]|nr:hypothetical protein GQ600_1218 [Phytophthora cactorum]
MQTYSSGIQRSQRTAAAWSRIPSLAASIINEFLDPLPLWPFEAALERGHARLIAHMIERNLSILHAGDRAARSGDLQTIICFSRSFPELVLSGAAQAAAANCHTHILTWLYEHRSLVCWGPGIFRMPFLICRYCDGDARFPIPLTEIFYWWQWKPRLLNKSGNGSSAALAGAILNEWPQRILEEGRAGCGVLNWFLWCFFLNPGALEEIWRLGVARKGPLSPRLHWILQSVMVASSSRLDASAYDRALFDNGDGEVAASGRVVILSVAAFTAAEVAPVGFFLAASNDHLAVIRWLLVYSQTISSTSIAHASGAGHLKIVSFLSSRLFPTIEAIDWAAASGHLDILRSIASGNIELFQWFLVRGHEKCTHRGMDSPVLSGNTGMLQFLRRGHFGQCSNLSFALAVACGRLHVTRWLFANYQQEWNMTGVADNAAKLGWSDEIINVAFGG